MTSVQWVYITMKWSSITSRTIYGLLHTLQVRPNICIPCGQLSLSPYYACVHKHLRLHSWGQYHSGCKFCNISLSSFDKNGCLSHPGVSRHHTRINTCTFCSLEGFPCRPHPRRHNQSALEWREVVLTFLGRRSPSNEAF